jgi:hypothetical protein
MLDAIFYYYSSTTSSSSGWMVHIIGCVAGKMQVALFKKCVYEINMIWMWMEIQVLNSSICCYRLVAFHTTRRNLAII